jgi:hypothetical protein
MNLMVRGQESQQVIGANPIAPVWGVGQAMGKKKETQ